MNLTDLSKEFHERSKQKGFDVSKENVGQTLMLVVTELGEAMQADRSDRYADLETFENCMDADDIDNLSWAAYAKHTFEENIKDTFEDEIADTIIRLLDLCGAKNIDIQRHIDLKIEYNKGREHKHGKKY